MSCEGWGVGDRCRATEEIHVKEKKDGAIQVAIIKEGDEGVVTDKYADVHQLQVFWAHLRRKLVLEHFQIHLLEKVTGSAEA